LAGGVFVNRRTGVGCGDECGGPGGTHGNGGAVGLDVDDALDGDLVGLELGDHVGQVAAHGGEGG